MSVLNLLERLETEEKMLNCTTCEHPWAELLPVNSHPKNLNITCPWCGKKEYVTTFVPNRLRKK